MFDVGSKFDKNVYSYLIILKYANKGLRKKRRNAFVKAH